MAAIAAEGLVKTYGSGDKTVRALDGVDLAAEVGAFGVDGPVALVTAGWEEGERNDAEIDRRLGGGSRNLNLYGRHLDVLESDAGYADAQRVLQAQLDELRDVYLLRLRHALSGVDVIRRRFAEVQRGACIRNGFVVIVGPDVEIERT